MQVNLRENEIAKAVEMYLKHHGLKTRGTDVTVQFSMGKGANGLRAEVNVEGLDKPCDIPGFGPHDREIDIPLQLLDTVFTEDEIKPGTLGALIQRHTEDVQVQVEREQELVPEPTTDTEITPVPFLEERMALAEAPWETEQPVFETLPVVAAGEPEITDSTDDVGLEVPVEVEAADHPVELAQDEVHAAMLQASEETALPIPEPVVEDKPVRRPIFGKKFAAEPEPVVQAEEAASLIPEDVPAPVVVDAAKTGPVRRSTSLFKKPAA